MAAPSPPMVEYALTKDAKAQGPARDAAHITVALGDDRSLSLRRTSVEIRSDMCVWRGVVEETGAPATIMWWPGGKMAGTVQHQGRLYSIRHLGGELIAVVEMGEDRMPQEHAAMSPRPRADDPSLRDDPLVQQGDASALRPKPTAPPDPARAETKGAAAPQSAPSGGDVTIDVIVAYTKKAAGNYADVKRELVDLAIEEGNESFRISSLGQVKLRLVHAYETDYVEEGAAHFDHVWRFADKGDGYLDEIHALRDRYKADVAILIVDDPKGCGLATRVFAEADEAFAVVHHECAASTYSLAHEIGHIIGARHDLGLDKIMTPFAYGHGYVNGTKWRDIMSYKESCGGCPRVPVWSSPTVLVRGEPAGTPELDNARVIREQAARVAAFR
jgi:peptidyl-Asp metalloendopeptidase